MKTLNDEEDVSLLEQNICEKDADYRYFDIMIDNNNEFNIAIATLPDEYILRMYDYYIRQEEKETDNSVVNAKLERLKSMISRLEDIPAVQDYICANSELSDEEQAEIDSIVKLIEERQKVKKMGPLCRFIYKKTKGRK